MQWIAYLLVVSLIICNGTAWGSGAQDGFDMDTTNSRDVGPITYKSFVSITGLVPNHNIQMQFFTPKKMSPSFAIGMSPQWSMVTTKTYDMLPDGKTESAVFAEILSEYNKFSDIAAKTAALHAGIGLGTVALAKAGERIKKAPDSDKELICDYLSDAAFVLNVDIGECPPQATGSPVSAGAYSGILGKLEGKLKEYKRDVEGKKVELQAKRRELIGLATQHNVSSLDGRLAKVIRVA